MPLLLSAVAATVVMLPWAIDGLPPNERDDKPPVATAPLIVERPLAGIGGGETIRDIHQDTPFSMVALTAADLTGTEARVRARKPDGSWGPWYEAEALEGVGDDSSATAPRGTDPVFVGRTTDVQIAVRRPDRGPGFGGGACRPTRPNPDSATCRPASNIHWGRTSTPC